MKLQKYPVTFVCLSLIFLVAVLPQAGEPNQTTRTGELRFNVSFSAEQSKSPLDGRVLLMISTDDSKEPRMCRKFSIASARRPRPAPICRAGDTKSTNVLVQSFGGGASMDFKRITHSPSVRSRRSQRGRRDDHGLGSNPGPRGLYARSGLWDCFGTDSRRWTKCDSSTTRRQNATR